MVLATEYSKYEIRTSTTADLAFIESWLRCEYMREGSGQGFWCNFDLIRKGHQDGSLLVLAEPVSDHAMGLSLGQFSIFEIHPNYRKRGLGRQLAEHIMRKADENGIIGLKIQCSPRSSIQFWQKLGFTIVRDEDSNVFAARLFPRSFPLSTDAYVVNVDIQILDASDKPTIVQPFSTRAAKTNVGEFALEQRLAIFSESGDLRIRLCVEDAMVEEKVKYLPRYGFTYEWPFAWAAKVVLGNV
jgi:GNAT superfamily N-acetyltransferase